jgi:hypothetical protein
MNYSIYLVILNFLVKELNQNFKHNNIIEAKQMKLLRFNYYSIFKNLFLNKIDMRIVYYNTKNISNL